MAQLIKKKFIGNDQVDGSKILLDNAQFVRAKKSDGSPMDVFRVNGSDEVEFVVAPEVSVEGTQSNSLITKNQLEVEVAAEASLRISGDAALQSSIDSEVTRATNAESALQGEIDAEETRALAAEAALQQGIDDEEARALAAEAALQSSINASNSALDWKPSVFLISEDPELRAAVEGDLISEIMPFSDDETPTIDISEFAAGQFLIAKNGASSKIMKIYDDAGVLKVTFVDVEVLSAGHSFIVRNDLTDSPGEQENRSVWHFTGSEMIKLGDFDWSFASGIDLSSAYASSTGVVVIGDSIEQAISKIVGNLAAEITRATTAEGNLQSAIDAEETRALAAESALQGEVDQVEIDLASEISRAQAAESTLQSNIDAESTARTNADNTLQSNIDAEQTRALAAESALQSNIDSEETRALAAESTLQDNIDSEALSRDNADIALQADIDSEIARAQSAEAGLQSSIDGEITRAQTEEASIRADFASADAALDSRIDALEGLDPLEYKGTWDASTNSPSLSNGTGNNGDVYRVTVAGSYDFGSGAISFSVGDKIVHNGTEYEKWDMTDAVDSVNGQQGAVVLDAADILMTDGLTTVQSKLETLESSTGGDISALEARVTQNESDIDALEAADVSFGTRMTTAESEIDALQAEDIALDGRLDTLEGQNLDTRLTAAESDIVALDGRVTALENAVPTWNKMKFALVAQDITNGYVDLAHEVVPNSIVARVDRLAIHEGEDFTLSVVGNVTRVTFAGDMVANGSQQLSSGDNLYFNYQY